MEGLIEKARRRIKGHWYAFAFKGYSLIHDGSGCTGSSYGSYSRKCIPRWAIESQKKKAKMGKVSVLVNCSYLGFMSKDEFEELENEAAE